MDDPLLVTLGQLQQQMAVLAQGQQAFEAFKGEFQQFMNSNAHRSACPAMPAAMPAASSSNVPVADEVDIDMEDQDLEPDDLTWADHLRGAQRQVTQQGAISLVNLLSKPPPTGPDFQTAQGQCAIQGCPKYTSTKAACN